MSHLRRSGEFFVRRSTPSRAWLFTAGPSDLFDRHHQIQRTHNLNQQFSSILWRRIDCPGRESACLFNREDSWHLHGSAIFLHNQLPCCLDYQIDCDLRWHTRSAKVSGWVGSQLIDIKISVSSDQRWLLNENDSPGVAGCVDVDLNFSPSTNLLPIRRLNLAIGQEHEVRAAWLRFPSFKLEPLSQIYKRIDKTTYRYESGGGSFVRKLNVNDAGFVTNYPELWEMEAAV
jgi:hypothetical protein